jgi:hypothetical protein
MKAGIKFKNKVYKIVAVGLSLTILTQVIYPTVSYALTSGPSQPEVQSFEPVGTTEMVDLFSGDFTYNIPLFELPGPSGGYPFNLHYNSGVTMDQEASWTGLGWNLNPGSITRQMRGLPDEYNGDLIHHTEDIKSNVTYGVGFGGGVELAGGDLDVGLGLSLGMSIYYNSYKGIGYSVDQGITISQKNGTSGPSAGVGLDVKMDSQQGVGVNASLSVTDGESDNRNRYSAGVGFNSKSGGSLSMGISKTTTTPTGRTVGKGKYKTGTNYKSTSGGSSVLTTFSGGFMPGVSMPMAGKNINLQFKVGGQLEIAYLDGYINGFYNSQYFKDRQKDIATAAYGYLNLQNAPTSKSNAMLDFNREKDGMIRKNSPNLPIPSLTSDIYTVTGQGISGMYRPFRNDVGTVFDPYSFSEVYGGSLGIEAGAGILAELGADLSANYSSTETGLWENGNNYQFKKSGNDGYYEPSYFKLYGEHSTDDKNELDYIGGTSPVNVRLAELEIDGQNKLDSKAGVSVTKSDLNTTESRESRNMVIGYRDNNQKGGMYALNADGSTYLYKQVNNTAHIECLYASGPLNSLRSKFPGLTINDCGPIIPIDKGSAGSTTLKYNYNNTNEYYKKTSMPAYAHSYVLEGIVGPDYVDADDTLGISDGDMGYWVKFKYNEFNNGNAISYNWRIPFTGANYIPGHYTTFEDDKGSYSFGTKEIYYLTSVQTKSHKAIFSTSARKDARGALTELQSPGFGEDTLGTASRKLDKITLISMQDLNKIPIKTIYFEYSYDLCKHVNNNDGSTDTGSLLSGTNFSGNITNAGGKLTLKRVWFTYQNNNRGSLSPYVFNYHENVVAENPNYNPIAYDRWGNYKPVAVDACHSIEAMYVTQFNQASPESPTNLSNANVNMAAWSLKGITLPSGGIINVEYEADDYAYVQNKKAAQMFQIESVAPVYGSNDDIIDHDKNAAGDHRRVYFKLEKPIPNSGASTKQAMSSYVQDMDKIYFKLFMYVRGPNDDRQDYISGYAKIDDYNVDPTSLDLTTNRYTRGYIQMGKPALGSKGSSSYKELPYHPFSTAAWQYIRTDEPQLSGVGPFETDPNDNKSSAMDKVKSLVGSVNEIITLLRGFNNYAHQHLEGGHIVRWGTRVVLDRSYIRLNSPDKKKLGGGVRVKKVVLSDNWAANTSEDSSVFGQVYDYRMIENGDTITSGVASYEPQIGGDENPFRVAKDYVECIPLKTNNNLFFEYPANESYYPGPGVGYRKVTVKSLATEYEQIAGNTYSIPAGIITTGAIVHEFYSAKEFPVITEETTPDINFDDFTLPIPLVGQIGHNKLTASQGYSIILNDMHGRPKKVSNYKQDKSGAILYDAPESYVEYLYSCKTIKKDSDPTHDYLELMNELPVLVGDRNGVADRRDGTNKRLIGQDYEFFTDMRHSTTITENGGLKINGDLELLGVIPTPFPFPWPSLGKGKTEIKLVVTNKIIHRSGVMLSTRAYDGGSTVTTENVLFDNQTGEPLLTRVSNDFDDPIYNYDMPAYFAFDNAGPAYVNIGVSVTGLTTTSAGIAQTGVNLDKVVIGDVLVNSSGSKIVYVKNDNGTQYFRKYGNVGNDAQTISGDFVIIRSGRRNNLNAKISNIKTLGDKTNLQIGDPTLNSNRY